MDQKIISNKHGFAIFPSVKILNLITGKDGKKELKWVKHLIFGDWIGLNLGADSQPVYEVHNNKQYLSVRGRNCSGLIEPIRYRLTGYSNLILWMSDKATAAMWLLLKTSITSLMQVHPIICSAI